MSTGDTLRRRHQVFRGHKDLRGHQVLRGHEAWTRLLGASKTNASVQELTTAIQGEV